MTGRTTNGHLRASFIPMLHCSGTLGDCTAIVREQFLYRTHAPYTHTGNTGQSRSARFSSPMCSRLATQRYSPNNVAFSPPGSGWSVLVSVCHGHLWLQRKSLPPTIPHICHKVHMSDMWRKICHVEKFRISIHGKCGEI